MSTMTFEVMLGRALGIGVAVSTVLLGAGLAVSFLRPGTAASLLLDAGLIVLMGTPMLRVVLSCAEFVRERDWFFAFSALGVIVVLAATIYAACCR